MAGRGVTCRSQTIQRGKMTMEDKRAIQANICLIEEEVDGNDIGAFLFANDILTFSEHTRIKRQKTREGRIYTVLENIFTRGPNAYSQFLAALDKANYKHVAEAIRGTRAEVKVLTSHGQRLDIIEDGVQKIDLRVHKIEDGENTVERLREEVQKLRKQDESSQKQIKILEDQLKEKDKEIEHIRKENKEMSERILTLEKEKAEIKKKLEDLTATNNRLEEKIEKMESDQREMEQKFEERERKLEERMEQKFEKRMEQKFEEKMEQMKQKAHELERESTESFSLSPPNISSDEEEFDFNLSCNK